MVNTNMNKRICDLARKLLHKNTSDIVNNGRLSRLNRLRLENSYAEFKISLVSLWN